MKGRRIKLKTGLEYDVVYGKKMYCYIKNIKGIVAFAKRCIRKRERIESKSILREELNK